MSTPSRICLFLAAIFTFDVFADSATDPDQFPIINPSFGQNYTTSYFTSQNIVDGDIDIPSFDPHSNNEFPKLQSLNASAWELWYFDAYSPTGAAITISFFRDGSMKKPLQTQIHAMWPGGEVYAAEEISTESTFEVYGDAEPIKASWNVDEASSGFEIAQDLKTATVHFNLPVVHGSLSFNSAIAPLQLSDDDTVVSKAILAPTIYWLQPIPTAAVDVALSIDGKKFVFSGSGGHDRFWTPFSWMTLMNESVYIRALVGPYTIVMLRIISRINPGRSYVHVLLYEGGEQVFETQNDQTSFQEDHLSFKLSYHSTLRGKFCDMNTGYVLDLVSPGEKKHWRFEVDHDRIWWNMPTGPVTGNSGFVDKVVGGMVGGKQYEGFGGSGQCQLPNS